MRVAGIPYVQGRNDYSDGDRSKFGIAIHNTSNDASDAGEASYATWRPDGTSAHFYADHDSVTQSIDTRDRAGHAGSTHGNDHGIAVEITGANGWSRERWLRSVAWDKLGAVLAKVIRHHWPDGSFKVRRATVAEMRRNPKVKAFYGHDDMRRAWGGTDHTDPGPAFPWDRLLGAVNAALRAGTKPLTPTPSEDDMPLTDADKPIIASAVLTAGMGAQGSQGSLHNWLQSLRAELKVRDEVTLAAVRGEDNDQILARIDTLAADLATRAEAEEARDAELRTLVQQGLDGTLAAEAVVARIGELLTAGTPAD
jgi:hypothetical protein